MVMGAIIRLFQIHEFFRVLGICLVVLLAVFDGAEAAAFEELVHPGYLSDVSGERNQVTKEVVIVPPVATTTADLTDQIFTEKMSQEFSREFRHRFGYTEFEQIEFTSNQYVETGVYGRLITADENIKKQESFGQFMAKELAEYHIDNYLKSTPQTKQIYKAKEAISNVEVKAAGAYKFKMRYKLSSNRLMFRLTKPDERFHNQIDTKLGSNETTMRLSYDLTKSVLLGTDYTFENQVFAIRGEKRLTRTMSTSLVGQSFPVAIDGEPKQDRVLLGLSWTD